MSAYVVVYRYISEFRIKPLFIKINKLNKYQYLQDNKIMYSFTNFAFTDFPSVILSFVTKGYTLVI